MTNYSTEPLHPKLAACVNGRQLRHPLVEFDYVEPCFYPRLNQLHAHRLKQQRGEYTPNLWDTFLPELTLHEREMKLHELVMEERLPWEDLTLYRFLGEWWTAPETLSVTSQSFAFFIGVNSPLGHTRLTMTDEESQLFAQFTNKLTVFRGHHPGLLHGLSWTLNEQMARQWSNRCLSSGTVFKKHVLAYFNRRTEDEIIVPTNRVMDITTRSVA